MSTVSSQETSPRKVTRHAVRDHIARGIATGRYPPGTKLVQHNIAKELEVSRAVVREAIFELSGMGLVETNDNRGAVVTEFNLQRLLECYEVREIIEGLAARRSCERITVKQLRELHELNEEIYRFRVAGDHGGSGRLDREFHLTLTRISGNRLIEKLSGTYAVLGKVVTVRHADPKQTYSEHRAILENIEAGNAETAEHAAREHVRTAKEIIRQHAEQDLGLEWIV